MVVTNYHEMIRIHNKLDKIQKELGCMREGALSMAVDKLLKVLVVYEAQKQLRGIAVRTLVRGSN